MGKRKERKIGEKKMKVLMTPKYAKHKIGDKVYFVPTPAKRIVNLKMFEVYEATVYQSAARTENGAVTGVYYMLEVQRGYDDPQYVVTTDDYIFKDEYTAGLYAIGAANSSEKEVAIMG